MTDYKKLAADTAGELYEIARLHGLRMSRPLWLNEAKPYIAAAITELERKAEHLDHTNAVMAEALREFPRFVSLEQRAEAAETKLDAAESALREINKLGAVCSQFEICEHPSCAHSAGAVLIAHAYFVGETPWLR